MTEEVVKILSVDVGDAETSVKQMRKEIKLLKDALLNLDESTEDYNKVLGALSDRMFAIRDANEIARYSAADLGEQIATVNRIATGLAAGFGAVQGAMALFGGESEVLEKTMVKLQATIALVQGLQGMEGLTKDLKIASVQFRSAISSVKAFITSLSGVQKALLATGIGAFIAAIGALTAAYIQNRKEADKFSKTIDNLKLKQEQLTTTFTRQQNEIERDIKILKAMGASEEGILEKRLELYQLAAEKQKKYISETQKQLDDLIYKKENQFFSGVKDEDIEKLQENLDEATKIYNEYNETIKNIETDISVEKINKLIEDNQIRREAYEERIAKAKEAADAEIEQINNIEQRAYESITNEITLRTEQFNKELELYQKYGKDTTNLQKEFDAEIADLHAKAAEERQSEIEENANRIIETLNTNITDIQNIASNKMAEADLNYKGADKSNPEAAYQAEVEYNNAILSAQVEFYTQERDLLLQQLNNEQLTADQRKEIEQRLFDNKIALSNAYLDNEKSNSDAEIALEDKKLAARKKTYSGIAQLLGGISKLVGENTKAGKAAAIAETTINTWASAEEAYRAAFKPGNLMSPALGAVYMAAAIATGLANIRSIMSVDTSSSSTSAGSLSASAAAVPSMNLSENLPVSYSRNLLSDTETDMLNNSYKVYVTEEDISNTQKKVSVTETNATF